MVTSPSFSGPRARLVAHFVMLRVGLARGLGVGRACGSTNRSCLLGDKDVVEDRDPKLLTGSI